MKKIKNSLKLSQRISDHLIQAIFIFTSVFLAFWLNDYLMERNERRSARVAQEAIIEEMKWNLKILERWTPYHKELFDKAELLVLKELDTVKTFDPSRIIDHSKGIIREALIDNAWNLLNQNQVKIDLHSKMEINRIYKQQNYVNLAILEITDFLKQRETLRPELVKENYVMLLRLLGELFGQESAMIREQKLVLLELENKMSDQ